MQLRAREKEKLKRKKRQQRFKEFKHAVPSKEESFSLCDAMRYGTRKTRPRAGDC
jgi:large subunit ribosomal protein L1